jgi:hypothetical protein
MIKLFSLKNQKQGMNANNTQLKRNTAAQIRITKGIIDSKIN